MRMNVCNPLSLRRNTGLPIVPAGVVPPAAAYYYDPTDAVIPTTETAYASATLTTLSSGAVLVWWQANPDNQPGGANTGRYWVRLYRDGTLIATGSMRPHGNWARPSGCLVWLDSPGPGSHTYQIKLQAVNANTDWFRVGSLQVIGLEHGSLAMPVTAAVVPANAAAVDIPGAVWTTLATISPRLALDCPVMFARQGPLLDGIGAYASVRIQRDGATIWQGRIDSLNAGSAAEQSLTALWVLSSESKGDHTYTLQAMSSNPTFPWSWPTGRDRMFAAIELRAGRSPLVVDVADVAYGSANVADTTSNYPDVCSVQHTGIPGVELVLTSGEFFPSSLSAKSVFGLRVNSSTAEPSVAYSAALQSTNANVHELAAVGRLLRGSPNPLTGLTIQRVNASYASYATGQRQAAQVVFDAPGTVPTIPFIGDSWTATNVTQATGADEVTATLTCTASTGEHSMYSPSPLNASTSAPTTIGVDVSAWTGVVDGCRIQVAGAYLDVNLLTGAALGSSGASGVSIATNGSGGWLVSFVAAIAAAPVVTIAALDGGATSFAATTADRVTVRLTLPHGITQ